MTTYDSPKSRYEHIYPSPYNSPNSPGAEQPAVAISRDRFLREIIHDETSNIYLKYFMMPKRTDLCMLKNQKGRNTTAAVGGGWYSTWYQVPGKLIFLLKGVFITSNFFLCLLT